MIEGAPVTTMEHIKAGEDTNEIVAIYDHRESSTLQLMLDGYRNIIAVPMMDSSSGSDTQVSEVLLT